MIVVVGNVCVMGGEGVGTGVGLEFPGFVEDVVWVMDVTSLPSLRRLASSRLVLVDDLQPKTKIQSSECCLSSAEQAAVFKIRLTHFRLLRRKSSSACAT
jgi:hypothetical protein